MKMLEIGYYKCAYCYGDMVTLLEVDESGRVVYSMTPLLCPRCVSARGLARAIKELKDVETIHRLCDFVLHPL